MTSMFALIATVSAISIHQPPPALTVVLKCEVSETGYAKNCQIAAEDPNTLGAGKMALSISDKFRPNALGFLVIRFPKVGQ